MNTNCILAFLIIFSFVSLAQQKSSPDSSQNLNNNEFQFYIYNQVIVAYKYNFNGNSGLRFKANITGFFNDRKSENLEYSDPETNNPDYHRVYKDLRLDHFFELSIQYLYTIKAHPYLNLFFGSGPFANYDYRLSKGIIEYYSDKNVFQGYSQNQNNENLWNLGISVTAGFECFVYNNINIFAEYEAAFSRGWVIRKYSTSLNSYSNEQRFDEWNYELRGLRLGIGIYF